jgi:hypothetical protein
MVEVHYRTVQANMAKFGTPVEPHHTRAVFEDEIAALGQLDYDINDTGLDPIGIFEHNAARVEELWDGTADGKTYESSDWEDLLILDRDQIRERVAR